MLDKHARVRQARQEMIFLSFRSLWRIGLFTVTNISILANLNLLNNHKGMIQLLVGTIVEVKSRVNCIFG